MSGELEALEVRDEHEQILATATERNFMGDISMLTGTATLSNARDKADVAAVGEGGMAVEGVHNTLRTYT